MPEEILKKFPKYKVLSKIGGEEKICDLYAIEYEGSNIRVHFKSEVDNEIRTCVAYVDNRLVSLIETNESVDLTEVGTISLV